MRPLAGTRLLQYSRTFLFSLWITHGTHYTSYWTVYSDGFYTFVGLVNRIDLKRLWRQVCARGGVVIICQTLAAVKRTMAPDQDCAVLDKVRHMSPTQRM